MSVCGCSFFFKKNQQNRAAHQKRKPDAMRKSMSFSPLFLLSSYPIQ
jgi:hypothetical protein